MQIKYPTHISKCTTLAIVNVRFIANIRTSCNGIQIYFIEWVCTFDLARDFIQTSKRTTSIKRNHETLERNSGFPLLNSGRRHFLNSARKCRGKVCLCAVTTSFCEIAYVSCEITDYLHDNSRLPGTLHVTLASDGFRSVSQLIVPF